MTVRRLWWDVAAGAYARERLGFPGARALLRVDRRTRRRDGATAGETRYFVTSLDPSAVGAARLLELVRGHWRVENCLHYEKDRWWDEDRHVCRRPGLARGFTSLMTASLTALRASGLGTAAGSLRAAADALCWDVDRALRLLTCPIH